MKKKKEPEVKTGLIVAADAKLGSVLLDEAAEHNRDKIQQIVVSTVGELLIQIDVQEKNLEHLRQMHAAIKAGQFEVNRYGRITYKDEALNQDARWISRCGQCGYDKIVIAAHRGGY